MQRLRLKAYPILSKDGQGKGHKDINKGRGKAKPKGTPAKFIGR